MKQGVGREIQQSTESAEPISLITAFSLVNLRVLFIATSLLFVRVLEVRLSVEQRHLEALAFGTSVLKPKLHVFRFESREFLSVRHAIELFGVL